MNYFMKYDLRNVNLPNEQPANIKKLFFVTPYTKTNEKEIIIERTRNLSILSSLVGNVKSYVAYIVCNRSYNFNLFFWFFEGENKPENAFVLLWLHGGLGHSMNALFEENAPY